MPSELLKLSYGPQTNSLPEQSISTNGAMYVHTASTNLNGIYDAKLFFDLGGKRYQIQGDKLSDLAGLTLQLGGTALSPTYTPSANNDVTWNIPFAAYDKTTEIGNAGLISLDAQTFIGQKTFNYITFFDNGIKVDGISELQNVQPKNDNNFDLGSSSLAWRNVYAKVFYGNLAGRASEATTADKTVGQLTFQLNGEKLGNSFNGLTNITWNIPLASASSIGLISTDSQSFAGEKTFNDVVNLHNTIPVTDITYNLGTELKRWNNVYANTFVGSLNGNATTATTANATQGTLSISNGTTITQTFNGSSNKTITLADLVDENEKIPLTLIPPAAMERIYNFNTETAANNAITAGTIQPGDLVQINSSAIMYYVDDNSTLQTFSAGAAVEANHVSHTLTLQIGGVNTATFTGAADATFNVPYASDGVSGLVSIADGQEFKGNKIFKNNLTIQGNTITNNISPSTTETYSIGAENKKYSDIYAQNFHGNATTATTANYTAGSLTLQLNGTALGSSFSGSNTTWNIPIFTSATNSAAGSVGLVPAPQTGSQLYFLRGDKKWVSLSAGNGISITNQTSNTTVTIGHSTSYTLGTEVNNTLNLTGSNEIYSKTIAIPSLTIDTNGHVTGQTITNYTATISRTLTEGTLSANILGIDIYSGIEWSTF